MHRFDIINLIAEKTFAKDYLEIGVDLGQTFNCVSIKNKDGVDPNPDCYFANFNMTSDKFFEYLNPKKGFDIVFIDGLHIHEQSRKDFYNSEKHLNPGGYIIFHDTNPPTKHHASEEQVPGDWNGSVYKTIMELRSEHNNLSILTVDTDWGVTIVTKGQQRKININQSDYNYEFFDRNRKELLNLISIDEFKYWLNKL